MVKIDKRSVFIIIAILFSLICLFYLGNNQNFRDLYYCVREPFPSMTSRINLVFGRITKDHPLHLTSQTPSGAVIFSDGIEQDYLDFNSGNSACIALADKKAKLIRK